VALPESAAEVAMYPPEGMPLRRAKMLVLVLVLVLVLGSAKRRQTEFLEVQLVSKTAPRSVEPQMPAASWIQNPAQWAL
jgi:hypothetical protein